MYVLQLLLEWVLKYAMIKIMERKDVYSKFKLY